MMVPDNTILQVYSTLNHKTEHEYQLPTLKIRYYMPYYAEKNIQAEIDTLEEYRMSIINEVMMYGINGKGKHKEVRFKISTTQSVKRGYDCFIEVWTDFRIYNLPFIKQMISTDYARILDSRI